MFTAKAVARTEGRETFAIAVFAGPVFKNTKKTAPENSTHATGNGVYSMARKSGNAMSIPIAETRK